MEGLYIRLKLVIKLVSVLVVFFSSVMIISEDVYLYNDIEIESEYLLNLSIPSINFEMNIFDFDNKLNNVDYHVEILKSSDIDNNVYIFAGHSGRGDNCYFNRLKEINVRDNIYIIINDEVLVYEVTNIYKIVKNGYMEVDDYLVDVLFLVSCIDHNRQLIVKGVLIN